jgi:hypothetical protein
MIYGRAVVRGRDQNGELRTEEITVRPLYYFWLGRDAYPEWPMVSRIANATTDPEEHEITPEMTEAGAKAIFEWREVSTAWDLAEEVYRAMELARRLQRV